VPVNVYHHVSYAETYSRFSQAWELGLAVANDSLFNLEVHLLLSAIGSRHKAIKSGQGEKETHQANATRPDFNADHMEGNHDAV